VTLQLTLLPERYAVCRLPPAEAIPLWAAGGPFLSISRSADELSIVCLEEAAPNDVQAERGWRCLKVEGPIPFEVTGVAAAA